MAGPSSCWQCHTAQLPPRSHLEWRLPGGGMLLVPECVHLQVAAWQGAEDRGRSKQPPRRFLSVPEASWNL